MSLCNTSVKCPLKYDSNINQNQSVIVDMTRQLKKSTKSQLESSETNLNVP